MSYWTKITRFDIVEKMKAEINRGMYKIREDGQFICIGQSMWDGPWLHQKSDSRWCQFWNHVLFELFNILPIGCRNCWKTVVRPTNLVDLFKLYELQKEMKVPSKCGIEDRECVHGLYGGYFYSESLEDGKKVWKQVKRAIKAKEFDVEPVVILKRGCTEIEDYFGASNKWDHLKGMNEMDAIEKGVTKYFVWEKKQYAAPDYAIENIHKKWIRWAYSHGDPTYSKFTDGQALGISPCLYHPSDDELDDVLDINSFVETVKKKEDKKKEGKNEK